MLRNPSDSHFGGLDSHVALEATAHSAADTITIPNANLLFSGDFKRAGNDLILSDDKQKFVVHDYFKFDKHPTLLSPKGAAITPDVVLALAGPLAPGQYAQATAPQSQDQPIGAVVTVTGNVVAIRNGVAVTLNAGSAVLKGDVLQTGGDGAIAVTFADGSTFNLGANARIVLSEFVYDPNGVSNSSVVNLVRGQLSFISGQIAHTGDMKVVTPVATMGIRGTVGILSQGDTLSLTVADEGDGRVHTIDIRDSTGNLIGRATSIGGTWQVSATGPLQVNAQETSRQIDQATELRVVQTLLNQQSTGNQIIQQLQQQQQQQDPKSNDHAHTTIQTNPTDSKSSTDPIVKITINNDQTKDTGPTTDTTTKPVVVEIYQQQPINIIVPTNPAPLFIGGPKLERVDVPSGGLPGATNAIAPDISADGRYVAFFSASQIPGQNTNDSGDVYLYDRQTNTTIQITHATGNVSYSDVSISQDGRYVVYQSQGDSTHPSEVFVYDRVNNTSSPVHAGGHARVDGNGGLIVMESAVPGQNSGVGVLVTDRSGNAVTEVSGNTDSVWTPEINADGRLISFRTAATVVTVQYPDGLGHTITQTFNENSGGYEQLYAYDRTTHTLQMVSVSSAGVPGNANSGEITEQGDDWPASFSADGRYVVFQSDATNLAAGSDGNNASDVFVRDLLTGTTQRISVGEVHTGTYAGQGVFQVNTTTAGDQQQSSVTALADSGLLVAWDDAGGGVFAQRYDVNGHTVGGQFQVSTQATSAQAAPAAAGLQAGGEVVVWTTASGDIHGQLFNASGEAVRGEFKVNTETLNSESQPAVTAVADGGFFVTWTSTGADADIHMQRYDSTGAAVGGEVTITAAAGNQVDPAITTLPDGGFIAAWTSPPPLGGNAAIFMQRFNANGTASNAPVQVDTTHTGGQSHAAVASLLGGGYVVAWTVAGGADGSGDGVYEQRYSSNGSPLGIQQVNTTTAGNQNDVSVAGVDNGGFIVTWTTANGTTVLGQAYDALGNPVGSEFSVGAPAGSTDSKVTTLPNGNIVVTWTSSDGSGTGISGQVFSDLVQVEANGASYRPEISADGRYITFASDATNLVGGDTNATGDTFVYDMVTQTIQRVSTDAVGLQTFGNATLGNAVSGGGEIVSWGGVAIDGQGVVQLQLDSHTIKFTAQVSDLGGSDPVTVTLKVSHGKISGSGLTIVNGQDGSNGTLVATGTMAQVKAAFAAGLLYTPTGSGNDALTIQIADVTGASFSTSVGFSPNAAAASPLSFNLNGPATAIDVLNGNTDFHSLQIASLDPNHSIVVTLSAEHGAVSITQQVGSVQVVNESDGSVQLTGSIADINQTLAIGLRHTEITSDSNYSDVLHLTATDGYVQVNQDLDLSFAFSSDFDPIIDFQTGQVIAETGVVLSGASLSTAQNNPLVVSDIFIADQSGGTTGIVLDDPAYTSAADPLVPAINPASAQFAQTGTQQIFIDQSRANPGTASFQKYGEVFSVPANESDLKAIKLTVSAPTQAAGGATHFELKLYEWSGGGPTGPAIYDSGAIALGSNGSGTGATPFTLTPNVPVQAGHQYVLEIVGDGTIGLATATGDANDGLWLQTGNGVAFNSWQAVGNTSFAGELDFQPALTTTGSVAFTDVNDTHTVSVSSDASATWGNLVAYVSTDTTGTNTAGAVSWAYEVDPTKAATLGLGEVHYDTFTVTLTDSAKGSVSTTVTVAVAGTEEAPKIISASPNPPNAPIQFLGDDNVSGGYLIPSTATSGTLTFKDVDLSDTHTVKATLTGASWAAGTSSFPAGSSIDDLPPAAKAFLSSAMSAWIANGNDSTWAGTGTINWSLDQIAAYQTHFLDFLAPGEPLTLTYTIEVDDPHLGSSTQTITVSLEHSAPAFIGWTGNGGDGDWNNGANWSTGSVPTAGDDVHIPDDEVINAGPYHVTNSATASANSITLRTADATLTNTGTITIEHALTLDAGSEVKNSGQLTVESAALNDGSSLDNCGTAEVTASAVLNDTGKITNHGNGQLTIDGSATLNDTSSLDNSATAEVGTDLVLNASGSISNHDGGQLTIDGHATLNDSGSLDNAATVEVQIDLVLNGNSTVTNESSGNITVDDGLFLYSAAQFGNSGSLHVLGAMTLNDSSGLSNDDSLTAGATTVQDGATLTNTGTAEVGTLSVLTGGQVANNGNGSLTVDGIATVDGATLNNNHTLHTGATTVQDGGILNNNAGGAAVLASLAVNSDADGTQSQATNHGNLTITTTLNADVGKVDNAAGTLTADSVSLSDSSTLTNEASLTVTHNATVQSSSQLTNTGTAEVGSLSVLTGGQVANNGSGSLTVDGTATVDNATLTNNHTLHAGATTVQDGGTFANDVGTATLASLSVTSAEADNSATLTVSGALSADNAIVNNLAGTFSAGSATLINDSTLTNDGTFHVTGATSIESASTLTNHTEATLHLDGAVTVDAGSIANYETLTAGDTTVQNAGLITNNIAGTATFASLAVDTATGVTPPSEVDNSGTLTVTAALTADHGTIDNAAGSLTADSATLTGTSFTNGATFNVTGDLSLAASSTLTSTGTVTVGSDITVDASTLTATGANGHIVVTGDIFDSGSVQALDGGTVEVQGTTIHNTSAADGIDIGAAGSELLIDPAAGHLTLNGGGQVAMSAGSIIDANVAGVTLENVDNTIIGAGQIGQGGATAGNLTLSNDGSGVIDADAGILSLNTGHSITNAGTLEATHGGTLNIEDAVTNGGTIDADDPSVVTLNGALTNTNLAEATNGGELNISGGFTNSGTIEADGFDPVTAASSTVSFESSGTNTNQIVASNGGALVVDATITNSGAAATVDARDGSLTIDATGAIVGTGTIKGDFDNQGTVEATGGTLTIANGDPSNSGLLEAIAGGTLDVADIDISNSGHGPNAGILIDGTSKLVIDAATVKLTGGGDVRLQTGAQIAENTSNVLLANTASSLALENVDNTIQGAGTIGADGIGYPGLALQNDAGGVIEATGGTLTVTNTAVTNTGTMKASGAGNQLYFHADTIANSVTTGSVTADGTIQAFAGATVLLQYSGVTGGVIDSDGGTVNIYQTLITGATLQSENAGVIEVTSSGSGAGFDNVTIAGGTTVNVGGPLGLADSIHNAGTLSVNSGGRLGIYHTVTLDGGGSVTLTGVGIGDSNTGQLVNEDNTISGSGAVTGLAGGIINAGVIEASVANDSLEIAGNAITNTGTLKATDGTLFLYEDTVTNHGVSGNGTVHADANAIVSLDNTTISGGVVSIDANGTLTTGALTSGDASSISGATITNDGTVKATGGTFTISSGTFTNDGSLEAAGGTFAIDTGVSGTGSAKIDGGATFELGGAFAENIAFNGGNAELVLDDGASVSGVISGLVAGDKFDLGAVGYTLTGTYGTAAYDTNTGDTTVVFTDGTDSVSLKLAGDYSQAIFLGSADNSGHTLVTLESTDDNPSLTQWDSNATAERSSPTGDTADHDVASGTIKFTDIDLTDRPVVTTTYKTFTYTDADHNALTLTDDEAAAVAATQVGLDVAQSGTTNTGSATWTYSVPDNVLDFLADGEILTLTYTATVNDQKNGSNHQDFTVTITGTNDTPAITVVDAVGAVKEDVGTVADNPNTPATENGGFLADTGSVTFADVDLTDHEDASVALTGSATTSGAGISSALATALADAMVLPTTHFNSNTGTIGWSFALDDSLVQYLAKDETVTATYTITLADDSGAGNASTTQAVTVTLTGTNDAPVVSTSSVSFAELAGTNNPDIRTITSAFSFTDVDLTDRPTPSITLGDVTWSNGTLSQSQIDAIGDALTAVPANGNTNNGSASWTYSVADSALDFLAYGESVTVNYTAVVDDGHGGVSSAPFTVTIFGADDAPVAVADSNGSDAVIASGVNPGNTAYPGDSSATGNVLTNDTDPDTHDTKTVEYVQYGAEAPVTVYGTSATIAGAYGTLQIADDGTWTYTLDNNNAATQALAQGEQATDAFTYTMVDSRFVPSTATLTINITGTNDAPTISGGPVSGTLTEDGTPAQQSVTGTLTAGDVDHNATHTWKVVGGTDSHAADYSFAIDNLVIVKNTTTVVSDDFSHAPGTGTVAYTLGVNGQSETLTNGNDLSGRTVAFLDAAHGVSVTGVGGGANVSDSAVAQTGTNPAGSTTLTKASNFSVAATFDLIAPNDLGETYGIRLTDRLPGNPVTVGGSSGDDVVELRVVKADNGSIQVQLRDIDFTAGSLDGNGNPLGTANVLQFAGLSGNIPSGEQIVFHLSHAANSTAITASYDLLDSSGSLISTTNFAATDAIFSDENWTQAQITASSPAIDNSYLTGDYGTLSVDPTTGAFKYALLNSSPQVQALGVGTPSAPDNFTLQVADDQNATASTTADFTVQGTNDAPVLTIPGNGTATVNEDTSINFTGAHVSDVDTGDTQTVTIQVAHGTLTPLGNGHGLTIVGGFDGSNGTLEVTGSTADVNAALNSGVTYTPNANYNGSDTLTITDHDAANANAVPQQTTITINSVNDAPSGADNTVTTLEDTGYVFNAADFGFTDPVDAAGPSGGNALAAVEITTLPGAGTLKDNGVAVTAGQFVSVADITNGKLVFTPAADANGDGYASFTFQVQDDGGTAHSGVDTDPTPNTITVNVTPVNDAPTVINGSTISLTTIDEDQANAQNPAGQAVSSLISGHVSDPDSTLAFTEIAITDNAASAAQGVWQYATSFNADHSGIWQNIPTGLTDAHAFILSGGAHVRFLPAQDYNGAAPALTAHLVDDSAGVATSGTYKDLSVTGGSTPYSAATITIGETINAVNDAPVLDGNVALGSPFAEDSANPPAVSVADILSGHVTDVDAGSSVAGAYIALTSFPDPATIGTFEYQVSGSSTWHTFAAQSANQALSADTLIRFVPAANYNGSTAITIGAIDDSYTGGFTTDTTPVTFSQGLVGDPTAPFSAGHALIATVTPVNDAPVATAPSTPYAATAGSDLALQGSGLSVSDVDGGNGSETITLAVGEGILTATGGTSGVTIDSGSGTGSVVVSGTVAQLNDFLAGTSAGTIAYNDNAASPGTATTLTLTIHDNGSTGGGDLSNQASATIDITPSAANAAPVVSIIQPTAFGLLGNATHDADVTDVTYADGHVYLVYDKLPVTQSTSDSAVINDFDLSSGTPTLVHSYSWSYGSLSGIAADASQIYVVGASNPGTGLTHDSVGGAEEKSILVRFNADGTAGSDPAPAIGTTSTNFFSYNGVESFQNVLATTQGGNTVLYAVGFGQPASYGAYVIAEYDSSGNLLHSATDPLSVPGFSIARDAVEFNGEIWAVGGSWHQSLGEPTNIPTVWEASYDLSSVATHKDTVGTQYGDFSSATVLGNNLYAVGNVSSNGGDYIIAKYDTSGDVVWSVTGGGSGADTLTGAVALNGHLYAVGTTTTAGGDTDGVLLEINQADGSVIGTQTFGGTGNDSANAIATDGSNLYIVGDNNSTGGAHQDFYLATDAVGGGTATTAEDQALTFSGINVTDADAGSAQLEVTLAVGHGTLSVDETGLDSGSTDNGATIHLFGSQSAIDTALKSGVVYTPDANFNGNDTLTVTADDQGHTGLGGAQSGTQSIGISVTAVNDAPTVTVPTGHYNATAQTDLTLSDGSLHVADVDGGSGVETVTLSVGEGIVTVDAGSNNVTGLAGNGTGSVSFSGTLAELNDLLFGANGGSIVYDDTAGNPSASTTLTLSVNDNGNSGSGGALTGSATATIDIAANDVAPVVTVPALGAATDFSVGSPQYVAVGDFNNDNTNDLAVSDINAGTVSVMLGDGSGQFGAPIVTTVGSSPSYIAAGYIDGDSNLDLAVTNQDSGNVSILLGNGDGTFTAQSAIGAGNPDGLALADFDNDGFTDLIIGSTEGHGLVYAQGNGDGTFQDPVLLDSSYQYSELIASDLDGDGNIDLIAAAFDGSGPKVLVYTGNGDGTFNTPAVYSSGPGNISASIALGDLNGDNIPDLAVANTGQSGISVLFGDGNGGFGGPETLGTVAPANNRGSITIGDFNHDGNNDIAVANPAGGSVAVFFGHGDGTFSAEQDFAAGDTPVAVASADFSGDNKADLVVGNFVGGSVSLLRQGTAQTAEDTPITLSGVSVSDVDALDAQIKVTLAVDHGTLSVNEAGLDGISTNNDGSIDLYGSQAAINAALATGIVYTPGANYNGNDTLTVTADDQANTVGGPLSAQQTFNLTVTPVNDAPVAQAGSASGDEDTLISGQVNAADVDSANLSYALVSDAVDGNNQSVAGLTFNSDGSYSFQGPHDFSGMVTFTYKANDGSLDSNVATATIDVAPVPDVPSLQAAGCSPASGAHDTAIALPDLTAALTDTDGSETRTVTISALPAGATLADDQGNSFIADSTHGSVDISAWDRANLTFKDHTAGTYAITATVSDTDTATLSTGVDSVTSSQDTTLHVTVYSDKPQTNDVSASGPENNGTNNFVQLTLSGTDDGTVAYFKIISLPGNGDLEYSAGIPLHVNDLLPADQAGTVYFIPDVGFSGSATFQYAAVDDQGQVDATPATVTIDVAPNTFIGSTGANWGDSGVWQFGTPVNGQVAAIGSNDEVNIGLIGDGLPASTSYFELDVTDGARVLARSVSADGITLHMTDSGLFEFAGGTSTLDGTAKTVFFNGDLGVANGAGLIVEGTLQDAGTLTLGDLASLSINHDADSFLYIAGSVTLDGGGDVIMQDAATGLGQSVITSNPGTLATLTNVNDDIYGTGLLGFGDQPGSLGLNIDNQAGADITSAGGDLAINTGAGTFTNEGLVLAVAGSSITIAHGVDNTAVYSANDEIGLETRTGGTLTVHGAATGHGSALIDGGTLEFVNASDNNVIFTSSTADTLKLADVADFSGTLSGFGSGDAIDLVGLQNVHLVGFDSDVLHLTYGDNNTDAYLTFSGNYTIANFVVVDDNTNGTDIDFNSAPAVIGNPSVGGVTSGSGVDQSGNLTAIGTIDITDPDPGQAAFQTTVVGDQGNLGTLSLAADGGYTYTVADAASRYLGANETKVDTFTVKSADGTSKQITFTIHGVNDAPTITATSQNPVDYGAAPSGQSTLSGKVYFTDPDFTDTHTGSYNLNLNGIDGSAATVTLTKHNDSTNGAAGEIDWSIALDNAALIALAVADQTVQVTSSLQVNVADASTTASATFNHTETVIAGDSGNNTLTGTSGDDVLAGFGGSDTLISGGGNDFIVGSSSGTADLNFAVFSGLSTGINVDLGAGVVTSGSVYDSAQLRGIAGVFGTSHNDTFDATGFTSTSVNHTALGVVDGVPLNVFEGGDGNDTYHGNGNTVVTYQDKSDIGVDITLASGTADKLDGDTDHFDHVAFFQGSAFADTFDASGFVGQNSFEGLGGDDQIIGNGATNLYFTHATSGVSIHVAAGTADGSSTGHDSFSGINTFQGSSLADTYDARGFTGFGGFNHYETMGGNDVIYGNGHTELSYENAPGSVFIDLGGDFPLVYNGDTIAAGSPGIAVGGFGPAASNTAEIHGGVQSVIGSAFNDTIVGFGGGLSLNGGAGDDIIEGHGAEVPLDVDISISSSGNDETATATVNEGSVSPADVSGLSTDLHFHWTGSAGNVPSGASLVVNPTSSTGNFQASISGSSIQWSYDVQEDQFAPIPDGQSFPVGNLNENFTVSVHDGHGDVLTGGAGNDTFVFNFASHPDTDTITDFTHGQDVLQIAAAGFLNDHGQQMLTGGGAPTLYNTDASGFASLQADVSHGAFVNVTDGTNSVLYWAIGGNQAVATEATQVVQLNAVTVLHQSDFHIV